MNKKEINLIKIEVYQELANMFLTLGGGTTDEYWNFKRAEYLNTKVKQLKNEN